MQDDHNLQLPQAPQTPAQPVYTPATPLPTVPQAQAAALVPESPPPLRPFSQPMTYETQTVALPTQPPAVLPAASHTPVESSTLPPELVLQSHQPELATASSWPVPPITPVVSAPPIPPPAQPLEALYQVAQAPQTIQSPLYSPPPVQEVAQPQPAQAVTWPIQPPQPAAVIHAPDLASQPASVPVNQATTQPAPPIPPLFTADQPSASPAAGHTFNWQPLVKKVVLGLAALLILLGIVGLINSLSSSVVTKTLTNGGYSYSLKLNKASKTTQLIDGSSAYEYGHVTYDVKPSTAPNVTQCAQIGSNWKQILVVKLNGANHPVCSPNNSSYDMYFPANGKMHLFSITYTGTPPTTADPGLKAIFSSVRVSQ